MTSSRETLSDLGGSSSSEEDGHRPPMERKSPPPAEIRRRHPFSVEALMAGGKTGSESGHCEPERASLPALPLALNYLCRERRTLPGASRKSFPAASPVKSEVSEDVTGSEDCAPWLSKSAFSSQPREFPPTELISSRPHCDTATFQRLLSFKKIIQFLNNFCCREFVIFGESLNVFHQSCLCYNV